MKCFVLGLVGCLCWMSPVATADPRDEIGEHIAQLDDENFEVRERASAKLQLLGRAALPALQSAAKTGSVEQRARVGYLLRNIHRRYLERGFEELGNLPEGQIEVEHGMWLIAQVLDPEVEKESIDQQFDAMAEAVKKKIGDGVKPSSLKPEAAVAVLVDVLKNDYGLHGDEETYDHPDNSSIHRVLARKKGLPILLSEIAVAVGGRAGLPIVGVGIPGRYMFKYDAPDEAGDILVDAYAGWTIQDGKTLSEIAPFLEAEYLKASTPRATIDRMMNNFQSDAREVGQGQRAALADALQVLFTEGRSTE